MRVILQASPFALQIFLAVSNSSKPKTSWSLQRLIYREGRNHNFIPRMGWFSSPGRKGGETRPVTGRSLRIYRHFIQKGFEIFVDKELIQVVT